MSQTLEYQSPAAIVGKPVSFYLLWVWNLIGIGITAYFIELLLGLIGDSYAGFGIMLVGIPGILGGLLLFGLPSLAVAGRWKNRVSNTAKLVVTVLGFLPTISFGAMTTLLAVVPTTHGGTC